MTAMTEAKAERFVRALRLGGYVRIAAEAVGVPEPLAYEWLLRDSGYDVDLADAEDVPCPRLIDAVYEHLRRACSCTELDVAVGLGLGRAQFARWMAKSGPGGPPACRALADAVGRALAESEAVFVARLEREAAAGDARAAHHLAAMRAPARKRRANKAHADAA
jgi:hypothetical protein